VVAGASILLAMAPAVAQAQQAAAAPTPSPGSVPARSFTAPTGLLLMTVRPERVADFERVIGFLQAALEKSADTKDRDQARGWRIFKAAEPGPGNTVLYVSLLDPTVPGADYGLGRILAEAYDTTQLQQIWKLYTGAVTSGGSLLNLSPVKPGTTVPVTPGGPAAPNAPVDRPLPPDADPNRP
jgi:hypothetical protein